MASITVDEFRAAMGSFAAGVTVITTVDEGGAPFGLTATAFSSVSKQPPLCLACVSAHADAHPVLLATRRFAVNFLSADQMALSERFATHGLDKFEGLAYELGPVHGCPLLAGTLGSVECTTEDVHRAGDHHVLIGRIERVNVQPGSPLVYFRGRYHGLTLL